MDNNLISVVMAVHNVQDYIISTLNAVKNQTYQDFEVIIVDDHSTDNTAMFIYNEFCLHDNRFKLFVNCTDKSNPFVDAHNLSYKLAKGKYLIRLDGDDLMYPNHLETIVNLMDSRPDIDGGCTCVDRRLDIGNGILVDYATSDARTEQWKKHEDDAIDEAEVEKFNKFPALEYNGNQLHIFNQASFLRKSWYDKCLPLFNFYKIPDTIFWWTVLAKGARLYKIPARTLLYRIHKNSNSNINAVNSGVDTAYALQEYAALQKSIAFSYYDKDTPMGDTTAGKLSQFYKEASERFHAELLKSENNGK